MPAPHRIRRQVPLRLASFSPPSTDRLGCDWRMLCETIGDRRAGSEGELRATDYLLQQFSRAGLAAHREPVSCVALGADSRSAVSALVGGRWERCAARELVGSASTPGGRQIEGELVWIEMPEGGHRITRRHCEGKIVLLFGPLLVDAKQYQRLVQARPAAVLHIDDRLPFDWSKSDALYPHWTKQFGAVPTVSIPYQSAWRWKARGVRRARVSVAAIHRAGSSANVIATLPGRDRRLPRILVTAHHDTQPGTVGADDNASGVVCLLELARLLGARRPMRRTLDFVSFGAEEQLSVGAAQFVRNHQRDLGGIGLVINLDSVASPLGHTWMYHSGQKGLAAAILARLQAANLDVAVEDEVSPFADHFPFSAFGVPSVWLYRSNVNGGQRWQHHSQHDSLPEVSAEQAVAVIRALGTTIIQLAGMTDWPWRRTPPAAVEALMARFARELYGFRPRRAVPPGRPMARDE